MASPASSLRHARVLRKGYRDAVAERLAAIIRTQNEVIAASDNLDEILQLIANRTQELCECDGAVVEMVDGDHLTYRATSGCLESARDVRLPVSQSLSGRCVLEQVALRCDDTLLDPRVNAAACAQLGIRSMVVVPLLDRSGAVGVLKAVSRQPHAFNDAITTSLQLMSGLITAAVSRAAERAVYDLLALHQQETARAFALAAQEQEAAASAMAIAAAEKESAANALAQKTAVIATFFEASPWMMGVVERVDEDDFRFLEVNANTCRMYQRTAREMRRRLASELGLPLEARRTAREPFDRAQRTGEPAKWQYTRKTHEGDRHFAGSLAPVPVSPGEAPRFCYLIEDITEQIRMRERLEVQQRMAAVGQLAAGVAHEVNNPLAYVIGNLNFANSTLPTLREKPDAETWEDVLGALAEAREGADRVRLVVKDLYSFVRADKDKDVREVSDLVTIAERAAHLTGNVVLPRARLVRDFHGPAPVKANASRLGQIVINLLANAAQAMPPARGADDNEIVLRVGATENSCFIEVRDNGVGMPPEVRQRIFEPFFTTKPVGQGMGLGLSICHTIATEHGGELCVESAPGEGTTFRLTLPAASS